MIFQFDKLVLAGKFSDEVVAVGLPVTNVTTVEGKTEVSFSRDLSQAEIDALEILVNNHNPIDPKKVIMNRIEAAMDFGRYIMVEFGAINTLRGLSTSQVLQIMTALAPLKAALESGSLYVALDLLAGVNVDGVLIRSEDVTYFRNKIQSFLGVPLT